MTHCSLRSTLTKEDYLLQEFQRLRSVILQLCITVLKIGKPISASMLVTLSYRLYPG